MVAITPDKYKIQNQVWTTIDQKTNCTETRVICPKCRDELGILNYGHLDIYLNSAKQTKTEIGADIVCKHAHFVMDVDKGRNVWCVIEKVMIPKKCLKVKYILDRKQDLPRWIRDKLDE